MLLVPASASAAVLVVNTTADGSDQECVVDCTLREAVAVAGPADSISVPAGTYVLSLGELTLVGDTLTGAGARVTIIDAAGSSRVMSAAQSGQVSSSISGVTIRGGNGDGTVPANDGEGGGILVSSGVLAIANSHVIGNTAASGGGIYSTGGGTLSMFASTVAGNTASTSSGSHGGGIAFEVEGSGAISNSTISGNVARDTGPNAAVGGGIFSGGGSGMRSMTNVTIAGNEASSNGGGGIYLNGGGTDTLDNAILADNLGGACAGQGLTAASHHNLVTDGTCTLTGPGNLQGVGALIGGLANNGGPTDTRALAPNSPAVNGGSGCATTDQRGVARPAACDIGAFEYVAPVLTVTTTVTNDHGFSDGPGEFSVHVRAAGADVAGSPQPGSAGTAYGLTPGTYVVSADARRGYTFGAGGACAADGSITLAENQTATCAIVANDPSPPPGKGVNAKPKRGTVKIKLPGRNRFRVLKEGELLPNGTTVDTLKGRVTLIAAADKTGKTTAADFYGGIFKIKQTKASKPTTILTLVEPLACNRSGKASAAAKRKKKRRLWGDGSGKFQTKGNHSAATVVGTKWLVEDRCDSTLTRVVRGKVSVRDFAKRKTVIVKKGKRYIARPG